MQMEEKSYLCVHTLNLRQWYEYFLPIELFLVIHLCEQKCTTKHITWDYGVNAGQSKNHPHISFFVLEAPRPYKEFWVILRIIYCIVSL